MVLELIKTNLPVIISNYYCFYNVMSTIIRAKAILWYCYMYMLYICIVIWNNMQITPGPSASYHSHLHLVRFSEKG